MGLDFLRTFPQYRALEREVKTLREEHVRLTTERMMLQDRLDAAQEDRNRLWNLTQKCLEGERLAYQSHINVQWQKQGGGVPYPEAPHLPPAAVPQPSPNEPLGRRGRILPSEAVARASNAFVKDFVQHK
jgi:hypothetical protein